MPGRQIHSSEWTVFQQHALRTDIAVVAASDQKAAEVCKKLHILQPPTFTPALVAAFPNTKSMLDWIAPIRLTELVPIGQASSRLLPAVRRAKRQGLRHRLAQAAERDDNLPPAVQQAVSLALRVDEPIAQVRELANAVYLSPAGLRYQWRKLEPTCNEPLQPKEFLSWALLLHAIEKRPGRSWTVTARELGISRMTLFRTAKRLTSKSLTKLEQANIYNLFKRRLARSLGLTLTGSLRI